MNTLKVCSKCGRSLTVVETRSINGIVVRRRECRNCGRPQFSKEIPIDYVEGLDIMSEYYKARRIKDGGNNKA